jgi:superfamily I DNA/RNA helicase
VQAVGVDRKPVASGFGDLCFGRCRCVKGDDQIVLPFASIFGWRGADITYIRRFAQHFPGATQVRLEENFRSTGNNLDAANAIIERDQSRLGKTLLHAQDGRRADRNRSLQQR